MRPKGITRMQWLEYNYYFILEHFIGAKRSKKLNGARRRALQQQVIDDPANRNRGRTIPASEIECDSLEEFRHRKGDLIKQPLIFRGAAKDWPCVRQWSKNFFREHFADTNVSLINNLPGIADGENYDYSQIDFKKYFEEIENEKDIYLRFSRVLDNNPILLEDLDLKWLRSFQSGPCVGEQTFLFMGETGTKTSLHAGFTHTAFIQVEGRKKWTLYAPSERFFIDPVADRFMYFYTHADPRHEDDPRYPLLPYAEKYELILEPGDVLWFPSLFWHYVENLSPNIGVAYKYVNIPQSFRISKVLSALILMSTKPTILESFIYNKTHKEDYIFTRKAKKKKIPVGK